MGHRALASEPARFDCVHVPRGTNIDVSASNRKIAITSLRGRVRGQRREEIGLPSMDERTTQATLLMTRFAERTGLTSERPPRELPAQAVQRLA